jgi:hypothetical protein
MSVTAFFAKPISVVMDSGLIASRCPGMTQKSYSNPTDTVPNTLKSASIRSLD